MLCLEDPPVRTWLGPQMGAVSGFTTTDILEKNGAMIRFSSEGIEIPQSTSTQIKLGIICLGFFSMK